MIFEIKGVAAIIGPLMAEESAKKKQTNQPMEWICYSLKHYSVP